MCQTVEFLADPPLHCRVESQEGLKSASQESQTHLPLELPMSTNAPAAQIKELVKPPPSTNDIIGSSSSNCNNANHVGIGLQLHSIDLNKPVHGSAVSSRLYWKSYPASSSSSDKVTIDDKKESPM
jgi:hypothetical protein